MKKILPLLIISIFLLCGCASSINKYKMNESDKYFIEDSTFGGNKSADLLTLNKVWTTGWLGSEKLVFDFSKDDQKASEIPYYTIVFNEDKTAFTLTIYHCEQGYDALPEASQAKYISEFNASKGDDSLIFNVKVLPQMKFAVDELNPSAQLVINIKKIENE